MIGKAILAPKNANTEKISDIVMDQCSGEVRIYPSADTAILTEDNNTEQSQLYFSEFLRSLKISDLPFDELKLKVGVLIILLQNLNPLEGLCNGIRLIYREF